MRGAPEGGRMCSPRLRAAKWNRTAGRRDSALHDRGRGRDNERSGMIHKAVVSHRGSGDGAERGTQKFLLGKIREMARLSIILF